MCIFYKYFFKNIIYLILSPINIINEKNGKLAFLIPPLNWKLEKEEKYVLRDLNFYLNSKDKEFMI